MSTPIPSDLAKRIDRPIGRRAALLAVLLVAAPATAWLIVSLLGVIGFARGMSVALFLLVLAIGYQLWWLRILAAGLDLGGRRIGGALWRRLTRRAPIGSDSIRATADDVQRLAVRTLEATSVFRSVGDVAALIAFLALGLGGAWLAAIVTAVLLAGWGRWLATLGFHGWLPIPEGE
jgi:hypothetical protein